GNPLLEGSLGRGLGGCHDALLDEGAHVRRERLGHSGTQRLTRVLRPGVSRPPAFARRAPRIGKPPGRRRSGGFHTSTVIEQTPYSLAPEQGAAPPDRRIGVASVRTRIRRPRRAPPAPGLAETAVSTRLADVFGSKLPSRRVAHFPAWSPTRNVGQRMRRAPDSSGLRSLCSSAPESAGAACSRRTASASAARSSRWCRTMADSW